MYSVVLIDDEILTLRGIKKTFNWEKYNFNVMDSFTDPIEALKYIKENKPDAIFVDIEMPEMSGIELIKQVRENGLNSKAIIVSAHSKFSYAQEAISYNVFEYILKPIDRSKADELLKKLSNSLNTKSDFCTTSNNESIYAIKNERFKMLINYIDNHFNESLTLNDLANIYGINSTYCCRLFLKYYSCNFTDYLRNIRMNKACELLQQNIEVVEVAEKVGYTDYFHFCKVFKKFYGITPYKYKIANHK